VLVAGDAGDVGNIGDIGDIGDKVKAMQVIRCRRGGR
jgi:hypothetical protein